ncbi:CYTH and CHAD domain-containing protein [Planctomonas psychrotolerans]|uniref:CYTH and CHAD domain-containing protein n=1 Tax=Planctomonas psychrotolerans TaxID=2528712 RepID=UPI001D0D160C|nr:CYTH and CHAD domain-containing protein [Planctomonas psychrotolerans]
MAASTQIEIERKYDADQDVVVPDFAGVSGISRAEAQGTVTLEAVYYDTEAGDLAANRITLRRRTGGKDAGWHAKLPGDAGRTEVHAPLGRASSTSDPRVPRALLDHVRVHVRDRPLVPVARISTTRTIIHLLDEDDRAIAELADDVVSATEVRDGTVRQWREWEAELLDVGSAVSAADGARILDAIEERLLEAGARPSASRSKLAHALGRDDLSAPTTGAGLDAVPARFDAEHLAAPVAVAALRALLRALKHADPAVRRRDSESVHDMRTGVRRLRSALAAFGGVFDREVSDDLRDRLRRLGSVLGTARDLEVRAARAEAALDAVPGGLVPGTSGENDAHSRLVEETQADYRRAVTTALRFLSSAPYYRLLDDLDAFVDAPPLGPRADRPAEKEFSRIIAGEVKRTRKRIRAVRRAVAVDDGSVAVEQEHLLHDARKAARRLRYTIEAMSVDAPGGAGAGTGNGQGSGPLGSGAKGLAKAAKRVQGALGDHRDGMLFAEHLMSESKRAHTEGESTFILGVLHERSRREAADALAGADAAFRALRKRATRWRKRR